MHGRRPFRIGHFYDRDAYSIRRHIGVNYVLRDYLDPGRVPPFVLADLDVSRSVVSRRCRPIKESVISMEREQFLPLNRLEAHPFSSQIVPPPRAGDGLKDGRNASLSWGLYAREAGPQFPG